MPEVQMKDQTKTQTPASSTNTNHIAVDGACQTGTAIGNAISAGTMCWISTIEVGRSRCAWLRSITLFTA